MRTMKKIMAEALQYQNIFRRLIWYKRGPYLLLQPLLFCLSVPLDLQEQTRRKVPVSIIPVS